MKGRFPSALAVAITAVLGCDAGFQDPSLAGPQLRLSAPPDDPSRAVIEVVDLPDPLRDALAAASLSEEEWTRLLRVSVYAQGADEDIPAMLGRYELVGDSLRFAPLFGLDPGRSYHVKFDPGSVLSAGEAGESQKPLVSILSLPKPKVDPTTTVEAVYPSSNLLPENQLKLYVHFSAPMRMGDGLPFIKLVNASGEEEVDPFLPLGGEFWDRERRRYTIFFDPGRVKRGILPNEQLGRPLREGGEYALVIDASWNDAEGSPLKESYRKVFRVGPADETPLDTATWTLRVPTASNREALVVDFPEPLDHGLMTRALAVETADGRAIAGDIDIGEEETRWAFTPGQPWDEGDYRLVASPILEDLAGNQIGQLFEVDVFEGVELPEERDAYRVPFTVTRSP